LETILITATNLDIFKDENIIGDILSNSKIKIYTDLDCFEFDKIQLINDNIFIGQSIINFSVEFDSKIKNINLIEFFANDLKTKISLNYNFFDFSASTHDGICSIMVADCKMISFESIQQFPTIINFNKINFSTSILINDKVFNLYNLTSISVKKSKKLSIKFEFCSIFYNDSYMEDTIDIFIKLIESLELGNNSIIFHKDFQKYKFPIGKNSKIKIGNDIVKLIIKN
jgi:hypothetical protein